MPIIRPTSRRSWRNCSGRKTSASRRSPTARNPLNLPKRNRLILVVSHSPELAEITRKAVGDTAGVEYARDQAEARNRLAQLRPAIVIIGQLENHEAVDSFCRELKQGWISRHSSLLVVEPSPT